MVAAVIVAAGRGSRMRSPLPKQVLPLAGRPLVEHSLRAFHGHPQVDRIVLVVAAAQRPVFSLNLAAFPKVADPVEGGETRQESVRRGLEAAGDAGWVLVHDAARPLLGRDLIDAVLAAARGSGAAVPACPVGDTVKRARQGRIVTTVEREGLLLVQTPQGFRMDLLQRAHRRARQEGFVGTDDAQLVERMGEPVSWVAGSRRNLKITTQEDLRLAEALLRGSGPDEGW